MSFDRTFKNLHMKYAYMLSSEISNIIMSSNPDERLGEAFGLYDKAAEEYIEELLSSKINDLSTPNKFTLLHQFTGDLLDVITDYNTDEFECEIINSDSDVVESFLYDYFIQKLECYDVLIPDFPQKIRKINSDYENEVISFDDYKMQMNEYMAYITILYEGIKNNIVDETFYLLFNDKMFLFTFNKYLSAYVNKIDRSKYANNFDINKHIKRCKYLPEWLQKAIYFRDNGICQKCGKDLSGFVRIVEDRGAHFDHIIPLEKGGTNDPTNFQLLCSNCNLNKSSRINKPKYYYQLYW